MSDEQNNCLITELYIDPAEMVPVKVSLRFIFDIIMQVFFSRQFSSLRFTVPGRCLGQGGRTEMRHPQCKEIRAPAAAPVRRQRDSAGDQGTQKAKKPKGKAACMKNSKPE